MAELDRLLGHDPFWMLANGSRILVLSGTALLRVFMAVSSITESIRTIS
jgi:hypothetical protein